MKESNGKLIYFDKLDIIGTIGDQYEDLESVNEKTDVQLIKDIKDLPSPEQLPKELKRLNIFNFVQANVSVFNEYSCRGRHSDCNLICINQSLFSLDRQNARENYNHFSLFEQRGKAIVLIYQDFFNYSEIIYQDFISLCNEVWREPYNYIVVDISKNKNINGELRIN